MERIRVLEVIRQGMIGGGESHVLDLVEHLNKNDFEPIVLSFTDGPMIDKLCSMGVKTYVIETTQAFDLSVVNKVIRIIRKNKVKIIHAHGTRANTNILIAAKSVGLPTIYTVHGWSFHDDLNPIIKKLRTTAERFLVNQTDITINVSQSNYENGTQQLGRYNGKVIKNGVNLKKFNQKFSDTDNPIRLEFGIKSTDILVGCINRITLQKDPITMIKAFHLAHRTYPALKLLMVGDGELRKGSEQLAEELGLSDNVIFAGYRKDVPDVLDALDVFCLPSLWEGLSLGLLEAMAKKKAIIATKVEGTVEVIKDRENGLLFTPKDHITLSKLLAELADSSVLRHELGQNAYKNVEQEFDVQSMTREVEEIYNSIA